MITNERQYRITRTQAARFEAALVEWERRPAVPGEHPRLRQVELDALHGQLDDLRAQLGDYDALRAGQVPAPELASYEDLPTALIRARIAAGLTQRTWPSASASPNSRCSATRPPGTPRPASPACAR